MAHAPGLQTVSILVWIGFGVLSAVEQFLALPGTAESAVVFWQWWSCFHSPQYKAGLELTFLKRFEKQQSFLVWIKSYKQNDARKICQVQTIGMEFAIVIKIQLTVRHLHPNSPLTDSLCKCCNFVRIYSRHKQCKQFPPFRKCSANVRQ